MSEPPADQQSGFGRREYQRPSLRKGDLHQDPIVQLTRWYEQAVEAGLVDANAMTLSTVSSDGMPSARIVLLKNLAGDGLVFYTNYASRKGVELASNPRAAVTFYWAPFSRQVRVNGEVVKLSREDADHYFHTRPRGSQLAALASDQSTVVPDREFLEKRVARLTEKYRDREVPLPPTWGGYRLQPAEFEFWQGRPNRLHDRFVYRRSGGEWTIDRLAP